MPHAIPSDLVIAARDGRLRVEFHFQCDRFIQQLFVDSLRVGTSIEGDPEETWPSSPPLQQLSLEEIDGSKAILGVGAAGKGHWSISVESDVPGQGPDGIRFDLACQSGERPAFLGSSYHLSDAVVLTPSVGKCETQGDRVLISPIDLDATTHRWSYLLKPAE